METITKLNTTKLGEERIIKRFAFLPVEFYNKDLKVFQKRWLEFVYIRQVYTKVFVGFEDGCYRNVWLSVGFSK